MPYTELWVESLLNRLSHSVRTTLAECNMCLLTNKPQYTCSSNTTSAEKNATDRNVFLFHVLGMSENRVSALIFCHHVQKKFQDGLSLLVLVFKDFGFENSWSPFTSTLWPSNP